MPKNNNRSFKVPANLLTTSVLSACLLLLSLSLHGADGVSTPAAVINAASAVEKEYAALQAQDDAATAEVEKWRQQNEELKAKGNGAPEEKLKERIRDRVEPVRKAYEDFIGRHPNHAQARLTFGSFLNELEEEAAAQAQWEKALELDATLAPAYNNLAGIYTEGGEVKKAFEYFTKAIELSPREASFYHNFGDSMYVLRKGVVKEFGLSEQEVD